MFKQLNIFCTKVVYQAMIHLPVDVGSDPRSEVDLWTSGRGPKVPQRSTTPPADSPMSMLLLEELMSDPALLNQPLQTRTRSVHARYGPRVYVRACVPTAAFDSGSCVACWMAWTGWRRRAVPLSTPNSGSAASITRQKVGGSESKFNQAWLQLPLDLSITTTCASVRSHLERVGDSVVVPRLLGRQAFMGRVAAVGEPRPLLKRLHALLSLL